MGNFGVSFAKNKSQKLPFAKIESEPKNSGIEIRPALSLTKFLPLVFGDGTDMIRIEVMGKFW